MPIAKLHRAPPLGSTMARHYGRALQRGWQCRYPLLAKRNIQRFLLIFSPNSWYCALRLYLHHIAPCQANYPYRAQKFAQRQPSLLRPGDNAPVRRNDAVPYISHVFSPRLCILHSSYWFCLLYTPLLYVVVFSRRTVCRIRSTGRYCPSVSLSLYAVSHHGRF